MLKKSTKINSKKLKEAYYDIHSGMSIEEFKAKYNVSSGTYSNIKKGKYKELQKIENKYKKLSNHLVVKAHYGFREPKTYREVGKELGIAEGTVYYLKAAKYSLLKGQEKLTKDKLSDEKIAQVYALYAGGFSKKEVMENTGVSETTVYRIARKKYQNYARVLGNLPKINKSNKIKISKIDELHLSTLKRLGLSKSSVINITGIKTTDYLYSKIKSKPIDYTNLLCNAKLEDKIDFLSVALTLGIPQTHLARAFNVSPMKLGRFIKKNLVISNTPPTVSTCKDITTIENAIINYYNSYKASFNFKTTYKVRL